MNNNIQKVVTHFLQRPAMWIHPVHQDMIVAFVHGLEAGANDKRFSNTLKQYLESNHALYGSNQGWIRQIRLYAEKMEKAWESAFFELAAIVLVQLEQ